MGNEQNYIKYAKLSGYKSIRHLECDFLPGLNLIIGDNGTGKTNFFEFVYKCMHHEYANFRDIHAEIGYVDDSKTERPLSWKWSAASRPVETIDKFIHSTPEEDIVFSGLSGTGVYLMPEYVSFSLPELYVMDKELTLTFDKSRRAILDDDNNSLPHFLGLVFNFSASFYLKDIEVEDENKVYDKLTELVDFTYYSFRKAVQHYSPVEDFRLSKSLRVVRLDTRNLEIRNVVFEYKLNGEWYSWKSLSDGTKRMLYLIANLCEIYLFLGTENGNRIEESFKPSIVFIEEPELGIHPHQLHLMLQFLKECAQEQQLFLATHSPQVLDILSEKEFDRIIIAEITPEKGTSFRHMTDSEKTKAGIYLKEVGFLSDYWRYSDFQRTDK